MNELGADHYQEGGTHYQNLPIQPWSAMDAWMTREQVIGYLLGCAIARLARFNARADGKGGLLDIKKARHELQRLIEVIENE